MNLARLALLFVVSTFLSSAPALAIDRSGDAQSLVAAVQPAAHDIVEMPAIDRSGSFEFVTVASETPSSDAVQHAGIGSSPLNTTGHTMSFRAKCRITGVHSMNSLHKDADGKTPIETMQVTLQPVFGHDEDDANKQWSKWTPSGELRLSITNPAIFPELVNGKTFFVDFTPVES